MQNLLSFSYINVKTRQQRKWWVIKDQWYKLTSNNNTKYKFAIYINKIYINKVANSEPSIYFQIF